MREPSRRFRFTALLLGAALALLLAEAALRVLRPAQISRTLYPCFYRPDPVLGFRYAPNARGLVAGHFEIHNEVETNALGFYDDEPLPASEARPRILAVGDSFTAAMNVAKSEVWTSVLERELRARGLPRADVVNLGLDGTGTDVHVALLREFVPRFRPDAIVLAFFGNDLGDVLNGRFTRECHRGYVLSYQTPAQREVLADRVDSHLARRLPRALYRHSFLVRLIAAPFLEPNDPHRIQFLQPRRAELGITAAQREARGGDFRRALRELEEIAATCDCRLLVVPVPPRSQADGSLEMWRRHAEGLALVTLDVLPGIDARLREEGGTHADLYFEHDAHLNARGNAYFGRALADRLAPDLPDGDPDG